jgi:ribosomal protein L7/L12
MDKRLGQWLLWTGIGSQVLPLLGMEDAIRHLLGYRHAQIGLLISVLGGYLSGFSSARSLPAPAKAAGAASHDTANLRSAPPSAKTKPVARHFAPLKKQTAKVRTDAEQALMAAHQDTVKATPRQSAPPPAEAEPATRRPAPAKKNIAREETPLRIVLVGTGPHRTQVIQEVQYRTGCGLNEVIGLLDSTLATIRENVSARDARSRPGWKR